MEDHPKRAQEQDEAVGVAERAPVLAPIQLLQLLLPALQALNEEQDLAPLYELLVGVGPIALLLLLHFRS